MPIRTRVRPGRSRHASNAIDARRASAKTTATASFSGLRRGSGEFRLPIRSGRKLGSTQIASAPASSTRAKRAPRTREPQALTTAIGAKAPA